MFRQRIALKHGSKMCRERSGEGRHVVDTVQLSFLVWSLGVWQELSRRIFALSMFLRRTRRYRVLAQGACKRTGGLSGSTNFVQHL